jgi:hypothetical protein
MHAWSSAFGKPLLCLIETPDAVRAYRFDNDDACPVQLTEVEAFPRGVIVGVG